MTLSPMVSHAAGSAGEAERGRIVAGLLQAQATVSPEYLYDPAGSRLFEAITLLDEYYPTATERSILARHARPMCQPFEGCTQLVEPGAGNCEKVGFLLPHLPPLDYVALDVSVSFVETALAPLRARFPGVSMRAVAAHVAQPLPLPPSAGARLFFYPGSSIGNFTPEEALALLARLHGHCGEQGGIIIGVDLVKDHALLDAAYNDALGVTAAFNRNVLRHLNRLVGADFDPAQWDHLAFFDPAQSRIEMHLRAREALSVRWSVGRHAHLASGRSFAAGQTLHTENSYKYTVETFAAVLSRAGFCRARHWTDPAAHFAVFAAEAGAHA